jgi:hypothetical protein
MILEVEKPTAPARRASSTMAAMRATSISEASALPRSEPIT